MVTGRQVRQRISQTFFSGNLMLEINIRGYEIKQIFAAEAQLQYPYHIVVVVFLF